MREPAGAHGSRETSAGGEAGTVWGRSIGIRDTTADNKSASIGPPLVRAATGLGIE